MEDKLTQLIEETINNFRGDITDKCLEDEMCNLMNTGQTHICEARLTEAPVKYSMMVILTPTDIADEFKAGIASVTRKLKHKGRRA